MRDQLKIHRSVHASTSSLCGFAMIQEQEVRSHIASLLANEQSIEDFSRWIVDQSWNMHRDSAPAAIGLVSDVQLLIAERDDSALSDEQFLAAVGRLVDQGQMQIRIKVIVCDAPSPSLVLRMKSDVDIKSGSSQRAWEREIPLPQLA
jgi:hypothetical protein